MQFGPNQIFGWQSFLGFFFVAAGSFFLSHGSARWIKDNAERGTPRILTFARVTWHLDPPRARSFEVSELQSKRFSSPSHTSLWSQRWLLAGPEEQNEASKWSSDEDISSAQTRAPGAKWTPGPPPLLEIRTQGRPVKWAGGWKNHQRDIPRLAANFTIIINFSLYSDIIGPMISADTLDCVWIFFFFIFFFSITQKIREPIRNMWGLNCWLCRKKEKKKIEVLCLLLSDPKCSSSFKCVN